MSITDNDTDSADFEEVTKNNFQQIKNKAIKIGYSDGVNDGRESIFQQGFDQGYKEGFTTAFNLEKFKFFFQNLKHSNKVKNSDLIKERNEFLKLHSRELKSLQIEDNSLNLESQDYVKEALNKYGQKMPIATNLLH